MTTEDAGDPEITGGELSRLVARIAKVVNARVLMPSLTAMPTLGHQPTVVGVPES